MGENDAWLKKQNEQKQQRFIREYQKEWPQMDICKTVLPNITRDWL